MDPSLIEKVFIALQALTHQSFEFMKPEAGFAHEANRAALKTVKKSLTNSVRIAGGPEFDRLISALLEAGCGQGTGLVPLHHFPDGEEAAPLMAAIDEFITKAGQRVEA